MSDLIFTIPKHFSALTFVKNTHWKMIKIFTNINNLADVVLGKSVELNNIIDTIYELRRECLF